MPTMITLDEAQARLREILQTLAPGEEVVITDNERKVATITVPEEEKPRRKIGTLKGTVLYMAPDFDEPLEEFREYMQ